MDWRESDGVRWLEADLGGARAAFTTRLGGVSAPPFDGLNLGVLTDDANDNVIENRRRLASALGIEMAEIPIGLQMHKAELAVHSAPQDPSPYALPGSAIPEVDGHVVSGPGLAPLVGQPAVSLRCNTAGCARNTFPLPFTHDGVVRRVPDRATSVGRDARCPRPAASRLCGGVRDPASHDTGGPERPRGHSVPPLRRHGRDVRLRRRGAGVPARPRT
ncbi:MAG: laccase domain-containing protein, partial [Thermoleophilia bacterium]|nr:laccase domain-containing protein [Thermoleophilia bacterium]